MSSSEDNMNKYESLINLLLCFPDFTLRHAMNAMFIMYTKAQIAKQSSHFGKKKNLKKIFQTSNLIKFSEHYSRAEFLPETSSYFDADGLLDLKKVYIYFTAIAACGMVSVHCHSNEHLNNFGWSHFSSYIFCSL